MNITARFASTCPCCRTAIQPGSTVEWSKGSPARHTACQAAPATSRRADGTVPYFAQDGRALKGAGNWRCPNPRDCGDPTCDGQCGY